MIYWHSRCSDRHPDLAHGQCPAGLLSAEEQREFARLPTAKRRHDWLLGRWTAKHLLQALAAQDRLPLPLEAMTIARNARNAPVGQAPGWPAWALSISHSRGRAVCAAAETPGALIGIDLDYVEPRSAAFVEDYFTREEQLVVHGLAAAPYNLAVMAIWCAKEAALKALQTGLAVDTRTVSCRPGWRVHGPAGWRPLTIMVDAERLGQPAPRLAGWWRPLGKWVLAVAAEGEAAVQGPPMFCSTGSMGRSTWPGS
jgi:4'-phosphopantetheinyl transferase